MKVTSSTFSVTGGTASPCRNAQSVSIFSFDFSDSSVIASCAAFSLKSRETRATLPYFAPSRSRVASSSASTFR